MPPQDQESNRDRERRRHETARSAQFFSLLIAAIGAINLLIYLERGSRLALVVVVIAVVALVGWVLYTRRVLRDL